MMAPLLKLMKLQMVLRGKTKSVCSSFTVFRNNHSSALDPLANERLHNAVLSGDHLAVEAHIAEGAQVNTKNERGWSALLVSIMHGHNDVFNTLLSHGASTQQRTPSGHNAFELALFYNHKQMAESLKPQYEAEMAKPVRNFFSHSSVHRHSHKRKDTDWLENQMVQDSTQYTLWYGDSTAVVPSKEGPKFSDMLRIKYTKALPHMLNNRQNIVFLGVDEHSDQPCAIFGIDLSHMNFEEMKMALKECDPEAQILVPFPGALSLREDEAALCGQGMGLMSWHRHSRFCSFCGSKTTLAEAGYKRQCTNNKCITHKSVFSISYPRTDPSVISAVLSQDQSRIILARQPRFPPGMYSCIAGFVEPGECVEEACRREVEEEVGVHISCVNYHSSQFWPMPSSLMLGCIAHAAVDSEIQIDREELEDACWFSRQEVVKMVTRCHPDRLFLPPRQTIAHQLVKHWLQSTAFQFPS